MFLKDIFRTVSDFFSPISSENVEAMKRALQAHNLQVGGAILNRVLVPGATHELVRATQDGSLEIRDWHAVLGNEEIYAGLTIALSEDTRLVI